jgi:hypothetical protein
VRLLKYVLYIVTASLLQAGAGMAASQLAVDRSDSAAIAEFDTAIAQYLAMRDRLLRETAGPKANSTAAQLTQASDALAAAIQRARRDAQVGAIFKEPVSSVIKRRIIAVAQRDSVANMFAAIDDEPPSLSTPAIHLRYPAASQLATMPPSLLAELPRLPEALEYRIVGKYLVLRDVSAGLIIDYIPAAVPR